MAGSVGTGNSINNSQIQELNGVGNGAEHDVSASRKDLERGGNAQSSQRPSEHSFSAANDSQEEHTQVTQENEANNPSSASNWRAALQELPSASREALAKAWNNLPEDPTGIWKQLEAKWANGGGDTAKKAALVVAGLAGAYLVERAVRLPPAATPLPDLLPDPMPPIPLPSPFSSPDLLNDWDTRGAFADAINNIASAIYNIVTSPVGLSRGLLKALVVAVVRSVQALVAITGQSADQIFNILMGILNTIGINDEIKTILEAIKHYLVDEGIDTIDDIVQWILEELGYVSDGLQFSTNSASVKLLDTAGLMENPSESTLKGVPNILMAIALTAASKSIDFKNAINNINLPLSIKEPLNKAYELLDTYSVPKTLVFNTLYYTVMLSNPVSGLAKAIGIEAASQLVRKGPTQLSKEALAVVTNIKEQAEKIASNPGEAADHTLKTLSGFIKSLTNPVDHNQSIESA